ncbi:MAG TPA: magnesium transporter [Candidatus Udaeobacter sp.]|nr:magnesium transporter [Candidatus Udaeobacter sp.]
MTGRPQRGVPTVACRDRECYKRLVVGKILEPEIRSMIEARNFAALREVFREWPPADVAEVILDLPEDEQVIIFRVLPHDLAADVFEYLDFEAQEQLLRAMAHEQVVGILNEMAPDDRTALLEELPSAAARQLIRLLTPEERRIATSLLGYPEDSVGRLMTPDFIAVHEDWTVQQVLDYVREHGRDSETLNFVYVVDGRGKLIDDVRMREFLLRPLTAKVSDIRDQTFGALNVTDSQQDALNVFRKYDRAALPVVDSNGVVVGIVTADDMLDVAEEQATEDIQKFGGMEALDEPYMRIPLWRMVRKRAGWLIILFLGEMLTATAMASYQEELAKALVLALFLPLIVSSGGNSGSQASTLMIRAMALGEVTLRDWWRVMSREVQAGLSLGLILGIIGVIRVAIWAMVGEQYLHRQPYGPHWPLVALTVGISLVGVVIWGTLSGSMLPFLLRRIGADPATSSAPFVATLVDVTGLIIYFSIALVIMRGVML